MPTDWTTDEIAKTLVYFVGRYLHIICTAFIVGGTLFYEMVVPIAIGELKTEQQQAVFARARWMFRWIVRISALVLLISGIVASYENWGGYAAVTFEENVPPLRAGWWWAAHASAGMTAIIIALFLTYGGVPPSHPVGWMRLNLVILMVVAFLGSATSHVRQIKVNVPRLSEQPSIVRDVEEENADGELSTAPSTTQAAPQP